MSWVHLTFSIIIEGWWDIWNAMNTMNAVRNFKPDLNTKIIIKLILLSKMIMVHLWLTNYYYYDRFRFSDYMNIPFRNPQVKRHPFPHIPIGRGMDCEEVHFHRRKRGSTDNKTVPLYADFLGVCGTYPVRANPFGASKWFKTTTIRGWNYTHI